MIVISDTSVITNLAAINQLELLPQLYNQISIPGAVYRELVEIDPPVPGTLEVQNASWIEIKQAIDRATVERLQNEARLDPGESEADTLCVSQRQRSCSGTWSRFTAN